MNIAFRKLIEIVQRGPYPHVACPFVGFVGETCHKCGATHNISIWSAGFGCGPGGFICERCDSWNTMSFHPCGFPHENPDYGYSARIINWAIRKYGWYREYLNG